jgi:hypothetical protein
VYVCACVCSLTCAHKWGCWHWKADNGSYKEREIGSLCQKAMVMVLEGDGYGVREQRLWHQRTTLLVVESNGYYVTLPREDGISNGEFMEGRFPTSFQCELPMMVLVWCEHGPNVSSA